MSPFPTDPDVTNSVIRFLGNQRIKPTLTHHFATLEPSRSAICQN
jgi:hypothetical protein